MKRNIIIVSFLIIGTLLFAQGAKEGVDINSYLGQAEPTKMNVVALKGPTGMGLVSLMDKAEENTVNGIDYDFELIGNVAEITPKLVKGEVDIAAVPANLASVIYNNTKGKVEVLAINTLGVLYLVGDTDVITNPSELKGKKIYASGKGATPEYALMYLLEKAGLKNGKDVEVEWKSEHAECVAALLNDKEAVAMLPQPFVTTALMKNKDLKVILDLNQAWAAYSDGSALITGVVVGRTEYIKENKEAVNQFLKDYLASTTFVNSDIPSAAKLVGKYSIVPEAVALKAIDKCNIVCITGDEMKTKLSGYLEVLYSQNPKAVGNAVPQDDFYYLP